MKEYRSSGLQIKEWGKETLLQGFFYIYLYNYVPWAFISK